MELADLGALLPVIWREYHEATAHTAEKLMADRSPLDWANMPDPFRTYEGAPVVDLPAHAAPPRADAIGVLRGQSGEILPGDGAEFLSRLLFHCAAVSASKVSAMGSRYALRVNPSSGNLHPTEFHFATHGLGGWPDGLYHYRPADHMAELRARGDWSSEVGGAALTFVLTSIAWRETWKYRERGYRYCLLDIGHAGEALSLAAAACGCVAETTGRFEDAGLTRLLGLTDEWPMLVVTLRGAGLPVGGGAASGPRQWIGGAPNELSRQRLHYPAAGRIHGAGSLDGPVPAAPEPAPDLLPWWGGDDFASVVRRRRSALDFRGGSESVSREDFRTLLECAWRPGSGAGAISLYLYVHRVAGLDPGVYHCRGGEPVMTIPGDHRVAIAGLSLRQDLAGNACVAFSMVADLDRLASEHGDRGYRYAFFEAGATGQRLYIAAEALGLQATGIGAFRDDDVHSYLGLTPERGRVVYHFACGYAVRDHRLEALS